jgi:hypothetical protein
MIPTTPATRRYRTTSDLTIGQRWLVNVMRVQQSGFIEKLRVEGGQPGPDRNLKVVRVARLGTNRGGTPVPVEASGDFELKRATGDLFDEFARIGNGVVRRLEFRYGLPFRVETTAAANCDSVSRSSVI